MTQAREWNASSYHRVSDPQVQWGKKVLARLPLRGDETVLDAGCGTGRLTAELLERLSHGHVIAIDASSTMLQEAGAFLEPRFGSRVTFIHSDLLDLDLDRSVDAVFSTATFHWIKDHPALFRRLHTALRPGGRLVAQCGGGPNIRRVLERAECMLREPEYAPFFEEWTETWEFASEATTEGRLRDAGFAEVRVFLEPAFVVMPDAAAFREYVSTVIFRPHLYRIPDEELRNRFLDRMTDEAAHTTPPYELDYWRLNMDAVRPQEETHAPEH